jgi:hypothetical protein
VPNVSVIDGKSGRYRVVYAGYDLLDLPIQTVTELQLNKKTFMQRLLCFNAPRKPKIGVFINPKKELGL